METLGYPRNVIVDTDMGWDDVISILLLMKDPNIRICGITVTGCGETHLEAGVELAQRLLALGNVNAPVCRGAKKPNSFDHSFPETFRATMDNSSGLLDSLPAALQPVDPRMAWDFIRDELDREEYQVTILSLGGLTNIANMLAIKPQPQLANIERIVIMGGAVNVDGNVAALNNSVKDYDQGPEYASNVYAEWNIFLDPVAASAVLSSPIPTTLVPLDACNCVLLKPEYTDMVVAKDPVAVFLKKLLGLKSTGPYKEAIPLPVFDPLATLLMAGAVKPTNSVRAGVEVVIEETEVDNTCGRTVANLKGGLLVDIVLQVSERDFQRAFAEYANAPMQSPLSYAGTKNVGIFLFEGIEIQDFCGAFEVFAAARHDNGTPAFNVFSIAESEGSVQAFAGPPPAHGGSQSQMKLTADFTLDNAPRIEVLVIVGGQGVDALCASMNPQSPLSLRFQKLANKAAHVVTICSGAIIAAKAGLLKGIRATTHHTRFEQLRDISQELGLGLTVVDTRNGSNFVQEPTSKVVCSGGVHCGLAAAVHVVGLILGARKREELAWEIMEYNTPSGCSYPPAEFPQNRDIRPEEFILGFSHLNVIMANLEMMEEATAFYARVLGFRQAWSLWLPDEAAERFGIDAGIGPDCRVMVRFLVHPNAKFYLELMMYDHPTGDPEIHFHRTNDAGGIRHVALEVSDAVAAYGWLARQEGVKLLADAPPSLLAPDPQTFFYFIDPYGVQWEFEQGRPMRRVINGIVG